MSIDKMNRKFLMLTDKRRVLQDSLQDAKESDLKSILFKISNIDQERFALYKQLRNHGRIAV